jgi:cell division protein FtsB
MMASPRRKGRKLDPQVRRKGELRRYLTVAALCFSLFLLFSFFSDRGLFSLYRLYRTEQRLRAQIAETRARNAALRSELSSWETDLAKIETVAREELGLVKPGELVYQF